MPNTYSDYDTGYTDGSQDTIDGAPPSYTPAPSESLNRSDLMYWQGHSDGYNKKHHQPTGKSWAIINRKKKGPNASSRD